MCVCVCVCVCVNLCVCMPPPSYVSLSLFVSLAPLLSHNSLHALCKKSESREDKREVMKANAYERANTNCGNQKGLHT